MSSFIDFFDSLSDPLVERTRKHQLIDILVITIAAVISGCDDWNEIELYGNSKIEWLKGFLQLPEGILLTIPLIVYLQCWILKNFKNDFYRGFKVLQLLQMGR